MKNTVSMAVLLALLTGPVMAQTPFGGKGQPVPTTPPGSTPSTGSTPLSGSTPSTQGKAVPPPTAKELFENSPITNPSIGQPVGQRPASAPSPDMKVQALFQADGIFGKMERPGAGGQIQEVWDDSDPRQGVYAQKICGDCVYKVRTREFMTTTIILPDDAVITSIDPGDDYGFVVKPKAPNKLSVHPTSWGMDSNINVYTKSGTVYPFYVRSERVNSLNVPDLVVRIVGREQLPTSINLATGEQIPLADQNDGKKSDPKPDTKPKPQAVSQPAEKKDFLRNVPTDPSKFRGWSDYKLSGDSELKPEIIWRDDFFTYIRYGDKWDPLDLPTAYVTVDGIDEMVNSRVQGTTFIVESVAGLITLKNGEKFLCIQYTGDR